MVQQASSPVLAAQQAVEVVLLGAGSEATGLKRSQS